MPPSPDPLPDPAPDPEAGLVGREPATMGRRAIAFALDMSLMMPVLLVMAGALVGLGNYLGSALLWLVFGGFFVLGEAIWNRTPGKVLTGMRVSRLDGQRRLRLVAALRRKGALLIAVVLPPAAGAPWVTFVLLLMATTAATDPRRRGLHDRIAATMVVTTRYLPSIDETEAS